MKKAIFSVLALGFVLLASVGGASDFAATIKQDTPPIQPPLSTEA